MLDLVRLTLVAGDGGHGRVSFRREKFAPKGGPDGGRGGDGGSIIFRTNPDVNTLANFAGVKTIQAEAGQNGGKARLIGRKGENTIVEVPVGTTVWLIGENTVSRRRRFHQVREGQRAPEVRFQKYSVATPRDSGIPARDPDVIQFRLGVDAENSEPTEEPQILRSAQRRNVDLNKTPKVELYVLNEPGQEVVVCKGGVGGHGNEMFKSSTNTTPVEAEYGTFGEQKEVVLELKLLADVGLIGLPNAGKSTLLSVMTKANPKIANYPFTTLEPHLGVMYVQTDEVQRDIVIADLPGLIEGASEGKGLGFDFLRHVDACRVLLYLLTLPEEEIYAEGVSAEGLAEQLWTQYQLLQKEVAGRSADLTEKPQLIAISKADLYLPEMREAIQTFFTQRQKTVLFFSGLTGEAVDQLKLQLLKYSL